MVNSRQQCRQRGLSAIPKYAGSPMTTEMRCPVNACHYHLAPVPMAVAASRGGQLGTMWVRTSG
jgi:hypothetical protein